MYSYAGKWCRLLHCFSAISFVVLETKLVKYDTAIFEPVVGNAGSHTLDPSEVVTV